MPTHVADTGSAGRQEGRPKRVAGKSTTAMISVCPDADLGPVAQNDIGQAARDFLFAKEDAVAKVGRLPDDPVTRGQSLRGRDIKWQREH